MAKDLIGYDVLVENGLRSVIREALRRVAAEGWPGTHHAYITFRTDAPGVDVPDSLRARYPDELTIVLQHQFWDLEVDDDHFAVTLSFSKVGHRLVVPFSALTGYADPSVKFGLQFGARAFAEARGKTAPEASEGGESGFAGSQPAWLLKRRQCRRPRRRRTRTMPRPRRAARRSWRWSSSARSSYSSHSRLPHTPISCPVMLRAPSCARKNAASATSSQEISERVEMKLT